LKFLFVNRTFLLLLGAFTLCGFTTAGVIDVYFIPYAISCGFTLVEGSAAYGVHGLGNLAGVILFSWMADHVHRPRLLASMFFLRALTFVLLLFIAADISVMFIFAAIFGILNFATFPVIANIVATHIGVRIIGLTLGLLFGGHSLGAALGVLIGGWMFDLTAKYDWVWWLSVVLAALAGVFSILVNETRPSRGQEAPATA
jgi:predicted MFS family arabinose efflux permease